MDAQKNLMTLPRFVEGERIEIRGRYFQITKVTEQTLEMKLTLALGEIDLHHLASQVAVTLSRLDS